LLLLLLLLLLPLLLLPLLLLPLLLLPLLLLPLLLLPHCRLRIMNTGVILLPTLASTFTSNAPAPPLPRSRKQQPSFPSLLVIALLLPDPPSANYTGGSIVQFSALLPCTLAGLQTPVGRNCIIFLGPGSLQAEGHTSQVTGQAPPHTAHLGFL
jgi:hypothetical protein